MHAIWFAPLVVAVVAMGVLAPSVQRAIQEARAWRRGLDRFGQLRPALVELRGASDELHRRLQALQER